jgi:hypothetical protein
MKQVHLSLANATIVNPPPDPSPTHSYTSPIQALVWSETEHRGTHRCAADGTFSNLVIRSVLPAGAASTIDLALRVNGVDTALAVSLSGSSATTASNLTTAIAVTAGDRISLHCTASNYPLSSKIQVALDFDSDTPGESIYGAGAAQPVAIERHNSLFWPSQGEANWNGEYSLAGIHGSITALYVDVDVVSAGSLGWQFVIIKNDIEQDGSSGTINTSVLLSGATISGNATFALPVVPGDRLELLARDLGGSTVRPTIGVRFTATTDGQSHYCASHMNTVGAVSTPTPGYMPPFGGHNPDEWNTSESDVEFRNGVTPFQLNGLMVRFTADFGPGPSEGYRFTARRNQADTALAVTMTDSTYLATDTGTIAVAAGDTLAMQVEVIGTPNGRRPIWVFGQTAPEAPPQVDGARQTVTQHGIFVLYDQE